jgi:hypothetical protein
MALILIYYALYYALYYASIMPSNSYLYAVLNKIHYHQSKGDSYIKLIIQAVEHTVLTFFLSFDVKLMEPLDRSPPIQLTRYIHY